jgi:hypothetical protein
VKNMFGIALIVAATITSCTSTSPTESPGTQLMRTARPIPLGVSQAVSLGTQVRGIQSMQLQEAVRSEFINLLAIDPLGNPSLHAVFTTPTKVSNWYEYGKTLTSTTKGTTTLVGASTAHNIIAGAQDNLATLQQIVKAIDLNGGKEQFKSLIATTNSFEGLYVANQSGTWISVNEEPQVLSPEMQSNIKLGYVKAADALVQSNVAEQLEGNWLDILEPKEAGQKQAMKQVMDKESLNLTAARMMMTQQSKLPAQRKSVSNGLTTQSETRNAAYCWWVLWWQVCVDQYDMQPKDADYMATFSNNDISPTSQGFGGGFNQYASDYNQTLDFNISGADNAGCGPSAIAGLINWHWQQGLRFDGISPFPNMKHNTWIDGYGSRQVRTKYTGDSPVNRLMARETSGVPKLSRMAGSFVLAGGTATTPWDMESSIVTYLNEQRNNFGVSASLESAYTLAPMGYGVLNVAASLYRATGIEVTIAALVPHLPIAIAQTPFSFVYNVFRQPVFADIMRRHIGAKDAMVVALYPTGRSYWEAHYSAIVKGRVIYHALRPEILIQPLDKFNGRDWYTLSDPMALFAGVYALNK